MESLQIFSSLKKKLRIIILNDHDVPELTMTHDEFSFIYGFYVYQENNSYNDFLIYTHNFTIMSPMKQTIN